MTMDRIELADELAVAQLTLRAVLNEWPKDGTSGRVEVTKASALVGEAILLLDPVRTL